MQAAQAAGQSHSAAGAQASAKSADDNVVDAEFTEVKDKK
jgi:molecular chaperone DnaK